MNGLDIALALVLIGGGFYGYRQGAIRLLAGIMGWVSGIALAFAMTTNVRLRLEEALGFRSDMNALISFLAVTVTVVVGIKLIGMFLSRITVRSRPLRLINSFIGLGLGMLGTAVASAVVVLILQWAPAAAWAREPLQRSALAARLGLIIEYPTLCCRTEPGH